MKDYLFPTVERFTAHVNGLTTPIALNYARQCIHRGATSKAGIHPFQFNSAECTAMNRACFERGKVLGFSVRYTPKEFYLPEPHPTK